MILKAKHRVKKFVKSLLGLFALSAIQSTKAQINMLAHSQQAGQILYSAMEVFYDSSGNTVAKGPEPIICTGIFADTTSDQITNSESMVSTWTVAQPYSQIQLEWYLFIGMAYPLRTVMTLVLTSASTNPLTSGANFSLKICHQQFNPVGERDSPRKNMVIDLLNNERISDDITFTFIAADYSPSIFVLRIDKLFAIREFSLNKHLFEQGSTSSLPNGDFADFTNYYSTIYGDSFTDDSASGCLVTSNSGTPVSIEQLFPRPDQFYPVALVSSVFIQLGPNNIDALSWMISSSVFDQSLQSWQDSGLASTILNLIDPASQTTGSYFLDLTTIETFGFEAVPILGSLIQFPIIPTTQQQVCTIQWFGWYHCQAQSLIPTVGIKLKPNENKWVTIGRLEAYYDPDLQKENNPFCQMGFKGSFLVQTLVNGVMSYQSIAHGTYYFIDPVSLEITMNTEYFTLNSLLTAIGTYEISFQMDKDYREDVNLRVSFSKNQMLVPFIVQNYCDSVSLSLGSSTLEDPQVTQTDCDMFVNYNTGTGVLKLKLLSEASCFGFFVSQITITDSIVNLPILQSETEFYACQSQLATPKMCTYFDTKTSELLMFSNTASPSDSYSYLISTVLSAYDSSDVLVTGRPSSFTLYVQVVQSTKTNDELFYAKLSSVTVTYFIGSYNSILELSKYYSVGTFNPIAWIDVIQTTGSLPNKYFRVNNDTLNFEISLDDLEYQNSTSVFKFCAHTIAQEDCNLTITVSFQAASESQIVASNTAPYFSSQIDSPTPIPCFGQNEASQWSFTFPIAFDSPDDVIDQSIKCAEEDIFQSTVENKSLNLKLDTSQNDLNKLNLLCSVTLSDQLGAKSIYPIVFTSQCYMLRENSTFLASQPVPTIRNISSSGEISITWNTDLRVPDANSTHRSLQNMQSECYNASLGIQIKSQSGSVFSDQRNLKFTQSVSKFGSNETTIQLVFENPADISSEFTSDYIQITFLKQSCFRSIQGIQVNASKVLTRQLPRQKSTGIIETPAVIQQLMGFTVQLSVFVLIMNFFLKGFLNTLLSSISSLAVVFHMFLVTLNYPVEMLDFFGFLFPLITFDAFPVQPLYERIFHFSEIKTDHALTDQFDSSGYSSIFIINNIGSLFLITHLEILFCLFLWLARRYKLFRNLWYIQTKLESVASDKLWNGIITFYSSNYLLFSVVCFIESKNLRFGNEYSFTENFCSVIAVVGMVASVGFPQFIYLLYREQTSYIDSNAKKFDKSGNVTDINNYDTPVSAATVLKEPNQETILFQKLLQSDKHKSFMSTYGSLIQGLRLHRLGRSITLVTPVINLLMNLLVAVSVTRLIHWPVFTIFVFNFAILFYTEFVLYFSPYQDKFEQLKVSFNAVSFLVLNYHLFLFTRYTDQSMFPHVANSVIVLIWFCIAINFVLTVPIQVYRASLQLQQQYKVFQYQKRRSNTHKLQMRRQSNLGATVQRQEEILADIENRKWENQLKQIVAYQENRRLANLDQLRNISERSGESSDQSQEEQASQAQKQQSRVSTKIKEKVLKEQKLYKEQSSFVLGQDQANTSRKEFQNENNLEPYKQNQNRQQNRDERLSQNSYLKKNQTYLGTEKKLMEIPELDDPLIRQFQDDFFPGQFFQATKIQYAAWKLKAGIDEMSYKFIDTRGMTVKQALFTLETQLHPIKWQNFHLETDSQKTKYRLDKNKNQELQADFAVILTAKAILTKDIVVVKEYYQDPERRTFKFFIGDQFEAQFSEKKARKNDKQLIDKIEFLVKRFQLGVTPLMYRMAVSGAVDANLQWYVNTCQNQYYMDKFGQKKVLSPNNALYTGEFSISLTMIQKISLYEHILCWIEQQQQEQCQNFISLMDAVDIYSGLDQSTSKSETQHK